MSSQSPAVEAIEYNKALRKSLVHDDVFFDGQNESVTQALYEIDRHEREAERIRGRQRRIAAANLWLMDRQYEWQDMDDSLRSIMDEAEFFRIPDYLQPL